MRTALTLAAMMVASFPALAADVAVIDHAVCRWLGVHVPSADVAYDPAAEAARGVTPADLPGTPQLAINQGFDIPIRVLMPRREAGGRAFGELAVGLVRAEPDGSVTFDGQPIDQPTASLLRASCTQLRPGQSANIPIPDSKPDRR